MRNDIWAPEYIERMRSNIAAGLTMAENASDLQRTFNREFNRNSVIGKAHRLGIQSVNTKGGRPKSKVEPVKPKRRHRAKGSSIPAVPRSGFAAYKLEPLPELPLSQIDTTDETLPELRKTLLDLEPGDCRWPYGDTPNMTFCGQSKIGILPYCEAHCRLAYVPLQRRVRAE